MAPYGIDRKLRLWPRHPALRAHGGDSSTAIDASQVPAGPRHIPMPPPTGLQKKSLKSGEC